MRYIGFWQRRSKGLEGNGFPEADFSGLCGGCVFYHEVIALSF
jgi:hypothetical protein